MAVGTIVIDLDNPSDSKVCEDLLNRDVVIVELGTRPTVGQRAVAIGEALRKHPGRYGKDGDLLHLTFAVNGEGRICRHDAIDDLDNFDQFDVLFFTDRDAIPYEGVQAAIEQVTLRWRAKGRPSRFEARFEYKPYPPKMTKTD